MARDSLIFQLNKTDHETVGVQMLISSLTLDSFITGVSTAAINNSHLDDPVYRVGITGDIFSQTSDHIVLSLRGGGWLGLVDTLDGTNFQMHTDSDHIQLHPIYVVGGKQSIGMELPHSTALVDVDTFGLSLELTDSDCLNEPYYMVRLRGFIVEATRGSIRISTFDD